ncbi:MAG: response regulator transcription factor, partial [bacterium]|nr:response regulator transcription factor [bacterium]
GVEGYLLKNADYKEIENAIINVSEGKTFFSKKILDNITKNSIRKQKERSNQINIPTLTNREKEILILICKGDDTFSISTQLFISERTVEKHKQNLMNKTKTHSTAKLIVFALKNNIVQV